MQIKKIVKLKELSLFQSDALYNIQIRVNKEADAVNDMKNKCIWIWPSTNFVSAVHKHQGQWQRTH
jgi:hypothetical protein